MTKNAEPLMRRFMEKPLSGSDIEGLSFEIIDREAPNHDFDSDQWRVVRRMVHTAGDFAIMDDVRFSADAISAACEALKKGSPIYTDTNMIRAGLSLARLKEVCPDYTRERIVCHIADNDIAAEAKETGLPRSLLAVKKASPMLAGAIALFGNAPVGLLELNRMIIEEGIKPALVIAVPVGFVHVEESKDEVMGLDVPWIALSGRRGGSAIAVSILHALASIAVVGPHGAEKSSSREKPREAVVLMGHGSRVPGADSAMEQIAESIRRRRADLMVETCSMSMLGERFGEVFDRCTANGASKIVVIPYFLHFGAHMQEDIPEILMEKAKERPDVKIVMGKHLGFDEKITDLVIKRIGESEKLEDVTVTHKGDKS